MWNLTNSGNLINKVESKQDKLIAWTWIAIDPTTNTISNTQTSAEWWNITWTLSDQTDLNTALNAKANDADVVKLTWAQTIAWTKTFQDEPIVPSKTRPAIYHWQKIATEAQVYAKQDKLTIGDWLKMEWTTLSVIKEPVEYSWGAWITITKWWDYSAMRGPAPVWFHVPSIEDRQWLKSIMDWLTLSRQSWAAWMDVLKLAPAGLIDFDLYTKDHPWKAPEYQWYTLFYWSSTPVIWTTRANSIQLDAGSINIPSASFRTYWLSVRCFKDSFVVPTSSWTVLNWTLWSAWVFWDSANWLISVTWNGTTWYTIMDKNLWANTVYNYWDTCTESNCWKYYQWWNNFWFDYAWPEYTTQVVVDASSYWPGNYYSYDEFFFWDVDWTDPSNDNLRWWVTWTKDSISNSWVTSVNWQTWDVSISSAEWWNITWTLSNQTDLNTALASKVWSSNNTINNVIHLSQADYDALATKDENTWYSTPDGASWWFEPENAGSTWQVLKKTATWYNWGNIDSMATTQPSNPVVGSSYYDVTNNVIKVYNWTTWENVGWGGEVPQATTEVIGTVRWATDTEIKNHTNKWSNNELLVMTPYTFRRNVKFSIDYNQSWSSGWPKYSTTISSAWQSTTLTIDNNTYIRYKSGILIIEWDEYIFNGSSQNTLTIENEDDHYRYSPISFYEKLESCSVKVGGTTYYPEMKIHHRDLVYISWQWDPTFTLTNDWTSSSITWKSNRIVATWFITLTPSVD